MMLRVREASIFKTVVVTTLSILLLTTSTHARYYDPDVGRFTSADTIVPSAMDPQSLNRYAYVRNNPAVLIDPTGHSWLSKNISKILPFVNPYIRPDWTIQSYKDNKEAYIAGGVGFITSGGNPLVAAAAFSAEMGMQTGEGRQVTSHVAKEVFVDVFGMNYKTAHVVSGIALRIVAISAMENMYGHFSPNKLQKVPLDAKPNDIEGGSVQEDTVFGPSARGGNAGDNYYSLIDREGNRVGTAMDRTLSVPRTTSEALNLEHTGVNIIGYNGKNVPGTLYGTWGVCHTATNRAMFQAGYSSTVSSLGLGGWSTGVTSVIYGNYGGGLFRAAYWGYDSKN